MLDTERVVRQWGLSHFPCSAQLSAVFCDLSGSSQFISKLQPSQRILFCSQNCCCFPLSSCEKGGRAVLWMPAANTRTRRPPVGLQPSQAPGTFGLWYLHLQPCSLSPALAVRRSSGRCTGGRARCPPSGNGAPQDKAELTARCLLPQGAAGHCPGATAVPVCLSSVRKHFPMLARRCCCLHPFLFALLPTWALQLLNCFPGSWLCLTVH